MVLKGQVLEKFFSISGGIFFIFRETFFISREIFLISREMFSFLGKYFLFLRKCFYFSGNAFCFSGHIFISCETFFYFSGNSIYFSWYSWFRKAVSEICRLNLQCTYTYWQRACFPQHNSMENLFKPAVQEEIRNFMEKKQDESMKSTCSSSLNIKDDLPKGKKSLSTGRNVWEGS